jgi:mannose-6-phosphate isomerase-like protein (cupin superfamily)
MASKVTVTAAGSKGGAVGPVVAVAVGSVEALGLTPCALGEAAVGGDGLALRSAQPAHMAAARRASGIVVWTGLAIAANLRLSVAFGSGPLGVLASAPGHAAGQERSMEAFELEALAAARAASGRLYHEFIRTHDLSVGLYQLAAGETDPQGPHTEDEVYHVVSGRARIAVGEEDHVVGPGSVIFVAADVVHRFHDIAEDLVILVFFGPAEYTHRVDHREHRPHGAAPA